MKKQLWLLGKDSGNAHLLEYLPGMPVASIKVMSRAALTISFLMIACIVLTSAVFAIQRVETNRGLKEKAFFLPELYISNSAVPFVDIKGALTNQEGWTSFFSTYKNASVFFDPRSGHPVNIIASIPMIPGSGTGNRITLDQISKQVGHSVTEITPGVVAELFKKFLFQNRATLGIDIEQLGTVKATKVSDLLWHLTAPQVANGVPVRYSRYLGNINNGNLVVQGVENWSNVEINIQPDVDAVRAVESGFAYVGARLSADRIWKEVELEIIPYARNESTFGAGYGHRLVWVFGFQRAPERELWELMIDAHSGEVISLQDKNHYVDKNITGGIYPLTNTEVCPDSIRCGEMQENTPMPFTNTGMPPPNQFTNSGGVFDYSNDMVSTTLNGPFVTMHDECGIIGESSATGDLNLGGTNGQHNCDTPTFGGNTSAGRSAMYEVNRIFEIARGYLPESEWVNGNIGSLDAFMNENDSCNAFFNATNEIHFYREGGPCRNAGEIASVLDHEWGHGMDAFDSGGLFSNSPESYADIAAIFRLWSSCIGYGIFLPSVNPSCGLTQDGTGSNGSEGGICFLDCSGFREADYLKFNNAGNPLTVEFTCAACAAGSGPCGREIHCDGIPAHQAAWNLVSRELQNPPGTDVDANTAFMIGDKLFYQGSGNIGSWHNCSCPSTSDGCAAANGYMQWITADDDDGNLLNGTPHMTDIFAAFNTNGIACNVPSPQDSGCADAPTSAPLVSGSPGNNSVTLNWNAVAGAAQYNVFRTDGHAGCNLGKALIGTTTDLSFTDPNATNERPFSYVVIPQAANAACFGPASSCVTVIPAHCAGTLQIDESTYSCSDVITISLIDSDLTGAETQVVSVTSDTEINPETITLTESPASSGQFSGTINTTGVSPASDGAISVQNGDTITVQYNDASSCGPPQAVTITATADCLAVLTHDSSTFTDTCSSGGVGNNDSVLDPGESAEITIAARNNSITNAAGVSANVSTSTPGVLIINGVTAFADIPAGGTATGVQTISIVISDDAPCFNSIDFTIDYTTDQGTSNDSFQHQIGLPGSVTYNSNDVPKPIADAASTSSTLAISDPRTIADLNVILNLTHTADGDLELFLVGPGGSPAVLLSANNGGSGDNYTFTIFDDEAATPIVLGTPPFTGFFRPQGLLSAFDGIQASGTWTLFINDEASGNSGTILNWSMNIVYAGGSQCNICESICSIISLSPPSLPDGQVGAAYGQTITAIGGTAPYTFTLSNGALPDGLNLDNATGMISGIPTFDGIFDFELTATDFNGCTGSHSYSINIVPEPGCLFCDDFEDGILATNWTYVKTSSFWTESNGNLNGTNSRKTMATANPVFAGCLNCYVEATMQTVGGLGNRVWLLHHFVDKNNFVEVLMKEEQDRWIIKQRINKVVVAKAKIEQTIDPNVSYIVRVVFDGNDYILTIDGTPVLTLAASGAISGGTAGFKLKGTTATFGYIEVNP